MDRVATKPGLPRNVLAALVGVLLLAGGSWTPSARVSADGSDCCAAGETSSCCCEPAAGASSRAFGADSLARAADPCRCRADESPAPAERPQRRAGSAPRDREAGDVAGPIANPGHVAPSGGPMPLARPETGDRAAALLLRTSRLRF
jgi:hypothetical protein